MCDKAVNTYPFIFDPIPDCYITRNICDEVVPKEPFILKHFPDKYMTQEMYDRAVDFYLITLKFVSDRFVTNKILEKLDNSLFSNGDIFFHVVDSNTVPFQRDDMGFNTIDLNDNNLGDDGNNFDEDDPETINHVRLVAQRNRFKQRKACKKVIRKELMPVSWRPTKWWDWSISENEKKKKKKVRLIKSSSF